jgi:hypothetical protein
MERTHEHVSWKKDSLPEVHPVIMEITAQEEWAGVEKDTGMVTTSSGFMKVAMKEG